MQTFLVGGPLNGRSVDLDETTKVLRVPYKRDPQAWVADSLELYALNDCGATGFRIHVGSEDLNGNRIEHAFAEHGIVTHPQSIVKYGHRSIVA